MMTCEANDVVPVANPDAWIGLSRPALAMQARLLLIPFAGGNASAFYPWIRNFGFTHWLTVDVVQPPGRGSRVREPAFSDAEAYIDALFPTVARMSREAPLFVLGYSMGAIVAYELCRRLQQSEASRPRHLFILARKSPRHQARPATAARRLSREEVLAVLQRLNGTPRALLAQPELLDPYIDSVASELHAAETYAAPAPLPLDTPITVLGGLEDPDAPKEQLFGWRERTRADFSCHFFSGGHFFVNTALPAVMDVVSIPFRTFERAIKIGDR